MPLPPFNLITRCVRMIELWMSSSFYPNMAFSLDLLSFLAKMEKLNFVKLYDKFSTIYECGQDREEECEPRSVDGDWWVKLFKEEVQGEVTEKEVDDEERVFLLNVYNKTCSRHQVNSWEEGCRMLVRQERISLRLAQALI